MLVDVDGGQDLAAVTLWDQHDSEIMDIVKVCNEQIMRTKKKQNTDHNESTKLFPYLPSWFLGILTQVGSYLIQQMEVSVPPLKLKANQFGHMVLTNVGAIGMEEGIAPMPFSLHAMSCICAGKAIKKPVVVDDEIVVRDICKLVFTTDHRFGDAANALPFFKVVKAYMEDPENFDKKWYTEYIAEMDSKDPKKRK